MVGAPTLEGPEIAKFTNGPSLMIGLASIVCVEGAWGDLMILSVAPSLGVKIRSLGFGEEGRGDGGDKGAGKGAATCTLM